MLHHTNYKFLVLSINSLKNIGYVAFEISSQVDVRKRKQVVAPVAPVIRPKRVPQDDMNGLRLWQATLLGAVVAGLVAWTALAYYPL